MAVPPLSSATAEPTRPRSQQCSAFPPACPIFCRNSTRANAEGLTLSSRNASILPTQSKISGILRLCPPFWYVRSIVCWICVVRYSLGENNTRSRFSWFLPHLSVGCFCREEEPSPHDAAPKSVTLFRVLKPVARGWPCTHGIYLCFTSMRRLSRSQTPRSLSAKTSNICFDRPETTPQPLKVQIRDGPACFDIFR